MILITDGNTKDSIFPPSNYSYNDRLQFCKGRFGVEPRPTWAPTEFGAHVRIISGPFVGPFIIKHGSAQLKWALFFLRFFAAYSQSSEAIWKQHYILQWVKGSMERWRV